jgi:hypothetical protein
MMRIKNLVTSTLLLVATGCAHGTMRGSVAMKASNDEAHVCLGNNEVKAGDRVTLFKNVCTRNQGDAQIESFQSCEKVRLGSGTVERILNEHYSLVKVDQGVSFEEGTVVEKQ